MNIFSLLLLKPIDEKQFKYANQILVSLSYRSTNEVIFCKLSGTIKMWGTVYICCLKIPVNFKFVELT